MDPERVRNARLEAGLTLAAVARTDISRTLIHQIERGVTQPSIEVLQLLARRTGRPVEYFVPASQSRRLAIAELVDELTGALKVVNGLITTGKRPARAREPLHLVERSIRRAIALTKGLGMSSR